MLPNFDSAVIKTLQEGLNKNGSNWFFGEKSRQGLKGDFDNLTDLVRHIKSGKASEKGATIPYGPETAFCSRETFERGGFSGCQQESNIVKNQQ